MKTKDIKKVSSLNDGEKDLIISHSGIKMDEDTTVCLHHEYIYLKRYSTIDITVIHLIHTMEKEEKVLIINHETFFKLYCNYRLRYFFAKYSLNYMNMLDI